MTTGFVRAGAMQEHRFGLAMVVVLAIPVVWGFGGRFFRRGILPHRPSHIDDAGRMLFVLHALAFAGWMALLVAQVGLVAAGRTNLHRRLGLASPVVLPAVAATGLAVAAYAVRHGFHAPGVAPELLVAVALVSLAFFVAGVGLALALRRRPAAHKRLMRLATMMVAGAGTTRIPQVAAVSPPDFDPIRLAGAGGAPVRLMVESGCGSAARAPWAGDG